LLAVADTDGDLKEARIRRAAPLAPSDLETLFADALVDEDICEWSARDRAVLARRRRRFGALALEDRPWRDAPPDRVAAALADGVRDLGLEALPWSPAARRLRARVAFARAAGVAALPDWSDAALLANLHDWLAPHLAGLRDAQGLKRLDLAAALDAGLDWPARQALDAAAPSSWTTPAGSRAPVEYGEAGPAVAVRVQELFGLDMHPALAGRPLRLELLSPARRPAAVTSDLPGFWRGGYQDLRKDLRGRYPRHPWPDRPWEAEATQRAKPRGT
ncbi:MAG: ATP-dependent helicase C-terminal domain-containing protein, partial [Pseudomonadota bacterium]